MSERFVTVGNGGAAVSAVKAMRAVGFAGEILMISDTDAPAFNPMLAPYYLKGDVSWEQCFPFGRQFYCDFEVTCHFGEPVERVDAVKQAITMRSGVQLSYDRCLVATGDSAVIPPVPGLRDSRRVFVLRSAESARQLERVIAPGKKAVVLGASFVGLKVAEILKKKGMQVILLDVVDQVLPRGAHPLIAAKLRSYLEENGIDVRLGCTMEGMDGARDGVVCRFSDGILEEADFVVASTGVRPNMGFLDFDQVDVDQGILVDDCMRTNVPNLYAAGDVCQGRNLISGAKECFGTWKTAWLQGRVAGRNMAGEDCAHGGSVQENISPFFRWTYAQIGDTQSGADRMTYMGFGDADETGLGLAVFRNDVIIGANLINCTHFAGEFRGAITRRSRVGDPHIWINRLLTDSTARTAAATFPFLPRRWP